MELELWQHVRDTECLVDRIDRHLGDFVEGDGVMEGGTTKGEVVVCSDATNQLFRDPADRLPELFFQREEKSPTLSRAVDDGESFRGGPIRSD